MSKGSKRNKVMKARVDKGGQKRQGCGFTNNDLTRAVDATGLPRTEVEQGLKTAFRKAKPGGDPVTAFSNISVRKGPRGQTAKLIIA